MINNPIVRRELLAALRTRKAIAMQVLFLLASALLLYVLWPEGGMQDIGGKEARRILATLALGELLMVSLFAPSFTAAAITSESERRTLESLFATAMKPWEIAVGKMAGSLGFLLLVVISGAPVLGTTLLLGGVTPMEILLVVGILAMTAVYLGMLGLLISTMMHRSYRAIIVTYAILLVVIGAAMVAWPDAGNLIARTSGLGRTAMYIVASMSPLEAMLSVVMPQSDYIPAAQGMPAIWQVFLLIAAAITVIASVATLIRLRRPVAPPRPREKLKVVERGLSARSLFFLIDPRKRRRMIQWWQNPILMKEFRSRPMLQPQWLLRTFSICLISSVVLVTLVSLSVARLVSEGGDMIRQMVVAVAGMMVVMLVLIGPAVTGGALCTDRETGIWDLMRATRVRSWRIVTGKLQAAIIPLLLISIAVIPSLLILIFFKPEIWLDVLRPLAVVGMTIAFVSSAGMFFSSLFSRTSTATAWTYAMMVTLGLASLVVLMAQDVVSPTIARALFILNPVTAAMDAAGSKSLAGYHLLDPHLKTIGAVTVAMLVISVFRVIQLRRAK